MKRRKKKPLYKFDWKDAVIAVLWLLLLNTNRRRMKSTFDLAGRSDIKSMVPTLINITLGALDHGNRVEILQNGEYFDRLVEDIRAAKSSIHIESYIWWKGEICIRVAEALADAARRGVEVRLLLDYSGASRMERKLMKSMKEAGCTVRLYHPLSVGNIGRMNNRTHRKICVVDGRISYIGGHGIAEQWTGSAEDLKHWRDTFARMEGPVCNTVQGVFCENWIEETGRVPAGDKYFPILEKAGETDAHVAYASPRDSLSSVQLLYYIAITAAQKELLIQNPYFLPHPEAIKELEKAVKRGVDVRVMLPSAKVIDTPIVQHASHHRFGDLLQCGVRIFEYERTLLHQKVMIVDGTWSCVGSTNFDDRSFELNDEVSVGFTDPKVAKVLRDAFFEDAKYSQELSLEEWKRRPFSHKLLDAAAFVFRGQL